MDTELKSLKIDRTPRRAPEQSKWARRWIIGGVALFLLLGTARLGYNVLSAAPEVETLRVRASTAGSGGNAALVLNATGYIVAHHKIEVAAKVIGKVAWIGVEKGDRVRQGQVLVRLEDDEYRAQVQQAQGQLANLQARLLQLEHGSRPEEIEVAKANLGVAQADMENARVNLERVQKLVTEGDRHHLLCRRPRRQRLRCFSGRLQRSAGGAGYCPERVCQARAASERHRHHRCLSRPQI